MPDGIRRWLLRIAAVGAVLALAILRDPLSVAISGTCVAAAFAMLLWLPRAAHRAFRRGTYKRARLLYHLLRKASLRRRVHAAVDVSLAACSLSLEEWERALAELGRVRQDALVETTRAAWLNNQAYALARSGTDPRAALACVEEAIALRPDIAGLRHTRGIALLALGRVDEAIGELDRMWEMLKADSEGDGQALEAERCYDLGCAWSKKGEEAYAMDYFQRAYRLAPTTRWGQRARERLPASPEPESMIERVGLEL